MKTINGFINGFGWVREYSTMDSRDAVNGFYTPWFNVYKNHLDQWVITHWSWKRDYIVL